MRLPATQPTVFVDLSHLDLPSTMALLTDLASREAWASARTASVCHWVLGPTKNIDVLGAQGNGPDFLRARLAAGDHLICTNPTGLDWNSLFPEEAAREEQYVRSLVGRPLDLALAATPTSPDWLAERPSRTLRIGAEGVWIEGNSRRGYVPWAPHNSRSKAGAWWLVPGQALFSLPPTPWTTLPEERLVPKQTPDTIDPSCPSPREKEAIYALGAARREPPSSPLRQAVLLPVKGFPGLGTRDVVDFEESLGGVRKRALIANMQGQTDLREAGLHVRFSGGRLVSVVDEKSGLVLCSGSQSAVTWGGKSHPFVINSAFSFEGDYSWGLRQSLLLEHEDLVEPGRAILDFFFVQESPELFVSATVRWPQWRVPTSIQRWAILETTLFEVPATHPLTSRVFWPDGQSTDRMTRRPKAGRCTGTDFLFTAGPAGLVVGFPQNQTARPHSLPWEIVRTGGKPRLVVNPEGGTTPKPSAHFDGVEEHFSFYFARPEGAKLPFEVTRKQAVELISPHLQVPPAPGTASES